jgi:hypothetical protein
MILGMLNENYLCCIPLQHGSNFQEGVEKFSALVAQIHYLAIVKGIQKALAK